MSRRDWSVPEDRAVQAEPSALVRIVPELPTAVRTFPFQARRLNVAEEPVARGAQKTPSGLVKAAPPEPTATNSFPFHATS